MQTRIRRTREQWTELVAESGKNGLTRRAFAQQRGISPTTLSWWACRLRREAREQTALVPVEVVEDSRADVPTAREGFRVELAHDRTVVVPAAFDALSLQRLVAALETVSC